MLKAEIIEIGKMYADPASDRETSKT